MRERERERQTDRQTERRREEKRGAGVFKTYVSSVQPMFGKNIFKEQRHIYVAILHFAQYKKKIQLFFTEESLEHNLYHNHHSQCTYMQDIIVNLFETNSGQKKY